MAGYKTWATNESMSAVDLNGYLATQLVPYFADFTARDIGIPAPVDGQMAYVNGGATAYQQLMKYVAARGAWLDVVPRNFWKDSDTTATTTTFANDPDIAFNIEASALYLLDMNIVYTADTASDIKVRWTFSGTINNWYWTCLYVDPVNVSGANVPFTLNALDMNTSPMIAAGGGGITMGALCRGKIATTTSGTVHLQLACNVAGNAALKVGTSAQLLKVG